MKTKILATAVLALSSTVLFAQKMTYNAGKTTFGMRGGVNFNTITGKNADGNKLDNRIKTGFHVGLNAEIPIGSGTYLQPGVLYTQKRTEYENGFGHLKLTYIEVPVNLLYKPVLGTGRVLLGFGPYVGFGLGGKQSYGNVNQTVEFTNKYDNGIDKPQFKGIDYGGNFLAGYEFANKFSFQINAQLGLANIIPEGAFENDKAKANNTGFGVSVGYRF